MSAEFLDKYFPEKEMSWQHQRDRLENTAARLREMTIEMGEDVLTIDQLGKLLVNTSWHLYDEAKRLGIPLEEIDNIFKR